MPAKEPSGLHTSRRWPGRLAKIPASTSMSLPSRQRTAYNAGSWLARASVVMAIHSGCGFYVVTGAASPEDKATPPSQGRGMATSCLTANGGPTRSRFQHT
ncbi:hypothetical protein RJ55_04321 [Drechmeria coniospora]|nr:hypothetical protein RJ55_04321 [Drechmeria coniospora]